MADIQTRISNIGPYFKEMKVGTSKEGQTLIYVITKLPENWVVDDATEEKYNVQTVRENGVTYFWADLSVGFDVVFDAIEYNITENKNAQEKIIIFNEKVKELQRIFSDNTYTIEQLRKLKFNIDTNESQLPFTPVAKDKKKKEKENASN